MVKISPIFQNPEQPPKPINHLPKPLVTEPVKSFLATEDHFSPASKKSAQTSNIQSLNFVPEKNGEISVRYNDEKDFINRLAGYGFINLEKVDLNRSGNSDFKNVYGFNIPEKHKPIGFKWNEADEKTKEWRPQGITGIESSGRKFIVTTWYATGPENVAGSNNQHKGARISLADVTNLADVKYRHILLVQDQKNIADPKLFSPSNPYKQLDGFAPVTIHAGGIASFANKLYVADTKNGIRVFSTDNILKANADKNKESIGISKNGELKAFDYRYILPESGYYQISEGAPFSSVSVDEKNRILWVGQYLTDRNKIPQMTGFFLNEQGEIMVDQKPLIKIPLDYDQKPVFHAQGVYQDGDTSFLAVTGKQKYEGSTARLVTYQDGEEKGKRWPWPHGAEDLYYDQQSGYLWNLTEYESSPLKGDNRTVFGVKLDTYR